MWFVILFFGGIITYLIWAINYNINKPNQEEPKESTKVIQNIENEYNELNNLIYQIEENSNEVEDNKIDDSTYYDDTVLEKEIKQSIDNIKSDELTANEVMFLKFMNNKSLDISFSPRWEFQYDLKPKIELAKLLKLEYLMQSSWYDNVKNATTKELKEILKTEELKVTGNKQELVERVLGNIDANLLEEKFNKRKYILTDKGSQILEKNKSLFMSDREKAGEEFEELTDSEYKQLQVFGKVSEYKRLKHNELCFEKGYSKNDILWSIYNKQILTYTEKKDYVMVGVVYDHMCNILEEQERYEQEIHFLVCCMYYKVYEMLPSDGIIGDVDYYESRMKSYCKSIKKIMKKNNKNIEEFEVKYDFITNEIKRILEHYIPKLFLEFEKVNMFQRKINEFLDA